MSDTFHYCGCQYEPDQSFADEHWVEVRISESETITHCDLCDSDINYEVFEYD